MGTCEKVLGTVDQLLIDNAIMEEVRDHHCNLAVAYYDYLKARNKVHHDWVYEWMGLERKGRNVIKEVMKKLENTPGDPKWEEIIKMDRH